MPNASFRVLKELFEKHLNFTPTAGDITLFEADLAVVSPSLMRASLLEIEATEPVQSGRAADWREAIFQIYNRKVAEHAQLFPLFHSFETAFRSTVAVALEAHYGEPKWWYSIYTILRSGALPLDAAKAIKQTNITSDQVKTIYYMLSDLVEKRKLNVALIVDGYELLEHVDLSHISALIVRHWALFRSRFLLNGRQLSQADFQSKFDRIKNARNSVYHHQSFSGFADTYKTAEELLACLKFPLARVHQKILESRCASPTYAHLIG